MAVAILYSRAQLGVDAPLVTIEVFLSGGLPTFSIVGMPETAVRESKDRVRSAILSANFEFPQRRITVNLGPADMRKTGGRFDLAIALGILAASGQVRDAAFASHEFFGELALNGELRRVPGALPAALRASEAGRAMVVPAGNVDEATLACDNVLAASCLLEVTAHLNDLELLPKQRRCQLPLMPGYIADLSDVKGQQRAKRALEIAAAGGHNLLFIGPPGAGKSMLAQRLPGLLPPLSESEAIATAAVDSVLGVPIDVGRGRQRPFRAPHHTATAAALVGGGSEPRPGEISRAHNGVLFLDELPEFSRHVLEVLREPLETGRITISRAAAQSEFPARFQLVAAMNPCPCGYLGDPLANCNCSADRVRAYRDRVSGPLLDRIDIQLEVQRPAAKLLRANAAPGEPSSAAAKRVQQARERQLARAQRCNAMLETARLRRCAVVSSAAEQLLERAADRHGLSARCYQRMLRVALTIADLAAVATVDETHMAEALSLRGVSERRAAA
ncbi:MAG: YifB family Mg chelatase-like AAA ATPase [Woeseia sp.]